MRVIALFLAASRRLAASCNRYVCRVGLLALALYCAGCAPSPRDSLRLCTNQWPGYEPLYLARSLGYFADSAVHLVEYPSATDCMRAFANATVEAAALTFDEALELADEGLSLKIVLVMNLSHDANVVLTRPEIRALEDLRGKRVGLEYTALGTFTLKRALERAGLRPADVHVLSMVEVEHERAYQEGKIDAVVTSDPARSRLLALGAQQLFSSAEIPREVVDVLIVRQQYIDRYPTEVQRLLAGWYKALDYLRSHPRDAAERMAPRVRLSATELLDSLRRLELPSSRENQALLGGTNPGFLLSARALAKTMHDANLLRHPLAVERLLHTP